MLIAFLAIVSGDQERQNIFHVDAATSLALFADLEETEKISEISDSIEAG